MDWIFFALNGDQYWTVLNTVIKHSILLSLGNFQLAVCFISECHDKPQFNWSIWPCLQDVSKTSFLTKAYDDSVFNMHIEYSRIE